MSEPKRYTLEMVSSEAGHIHWMHDNEEGLSAPLGEYVRWEDYDATCETLAHTETERDASDAEVEQLKAEVERLTKLCQATSPDGFVHVRDIKHHPIMGPAWEERQKVANLIPPIVESNAIPEGQAVLVNIYQHQQDAEEIKRLKAEVERLTNENGNNFVMKEEWYLKCMSARAEVERLRKAGDWMYNAVILNSELEMDKAMDAWNAAKEGKPSA